MRLNWKRSSFRPIPSSDDEFEDFEQKRPRHSPSRYRPFYLSLILNVILLPFGIYAILGGPPLSDLFNPARTSHELSHPKFGEEFRTFDLQWEKSPYIGLPSKERDEAWAELFHHTPIRASKHEMESLNETSMEREDGSFVLGLSVFHDMHCLNHFRRMLHFEHYWPDGDRSSQIEHSYHCLHLLRQSLVCHGDVTPFTFKTLTVMGSAGTHRCVDLENVRAWLASRG